MDRHETVTVNKAELGLVLKYSWFEGRRVSASEARRPNCPLCAPPVVALLQLAEIAADVECGELRCFCVKQIEGGPATTPRRPQSAAQPRRRWSERNAFMRPWAETTVGWGPNQSLVRDDRTCRVLMREVAERSARRQRLMRASAARHAERRD